MERSKMTREEQLDLWVQGQSVHNAERDECCPDFSCCRPELLQPPEVRASFQRADDDERFKYLMDFLHALLQSKGPPIAIEVRNWRVRRLQETERGRRLHSAPEAEKDQ